MAQFIYQGPRQSISLATGRTKSKDGRLVSKFEDFGFVPGRETPDLPDDNPIIAAMIENSLLKPIPASEKTPGKSPNKGDK